MSANVDAICLEHCDPYEDCRILMDFAEAAMSQYRKWIENYFLIRIVGM